MTHHKLDRLCSDNQDVTSSLSTAVMVVSCYLDECNVTALDSVQILQVRCTRRLSGTTFVSPQLL